MQDEVAIKYALIAGFAFGAATFATLLLVPFDLSAKMFVIQAGETFKPMSVDSLLVKGLIALISGSLTMELIRYYIRHQAKEKKLGQPPV